MEIRRLQPSDWLAMARLRSTRPNHIGVRTQTITLSPITSVSPKYQKDPHSAWGAFEDGKLQAFICCYVNADYWVLDLMVSRGDASALQQILERCLQYHESKGINQFYYAFPTKWARAYRSFWRDGAPSLRKYHIEDLCIIEANKVPSDPMIWDHIVHQVIVPVDLTLRRSVWANT